MTQDPQQQDLSKNASQNQEQFKNISNVTVTQHTVHVTTKNAYDKIDVA